MNRSQEHVDQLLSGYLDDALAADERAEVERWLREDASIAAQYDDLQSIRRVLQAIATADQKRTLPTDFSGRVMEASVARARAEGVSEDHPLIRVSEQPTSLIEPVSATSWTKVASALVAIAASVAVAVVVLQPGDVSVAERATSHPDLGKALTPPSDSVAKIEKDDSMIAGLSPQQKLMAEPEATVASPRIEAAKQPPRGDKPTNSVASMMTTEGSKVHMEAIVSSSLSSQLDVVLVIDVQLTELGRATGAVRKAMRTSSILQSGQQSVAASPVKATLVASGQEKDQPVSVFFLQAPAKRLDQFYLRLLADDAGVASVGMTVATDVSIPGAVEKVDINATDVKHDGLLQVADPAMGMQQLGSRLGRLSYLPFDAAMVGAVTPDSGVDFPTQVLVRVR